MKKTPEIYNVAPHAARPTTADDSMLDRITPATDSQGEKCYLAMVCIPG